MKNNNDILEPIEAYNDRYKDEIRVNAEKYFDEMAKEANVDIEANRNTIKAYNENRSNNSKVEKRIANQKALKGLLYVLIGVLVALIVILIIANYQSNIVVAIVGSVVSLLLIVVFILLIKKKIEPKIAKLLEADKKEDAEAERLNKEAWSQMAKLNSLYDWSMPQRIITQTIPLINFDENFDIKKYEYLHNKYGFEFDGSNNSSTYFCQSGSILGNPFLIVREHNQVMVNKTYTGTKVIHYTTRTHTKQGVQVQHHTQTLVATVTRPAPSYSYDTYLIYGNEAAPNLKFSRQPSGIKNCSSDKEIQKFIKVKIKEAEKLERTAIDRGSNFTKLANDKFEALFGAQNRDNEVEFRLLFTPLAQDNILDIITGKKSPYGDDFFMEKAKQLNFIQSEHSQTQDYYANPLKFVLNDFDKAKENFINYICEYFKGFFFDLAPLLSIPLYQQHKTIEYIYQREYKSNVSPCEHEVVANSFDVSLLKHKSAKTPSIIKTRFVKKTADIDEVNIEAFAFDAKKRVTYINKYGRDGRMHSVPVYWLEYVPVSNVTNMAITNKKSSRCEYNAIKNKSEFAEIIGKGMVKASVYERGIFAFLTSRAITASDSGKLNELFNLANSPKTDKLDDVLDLLDKELKMEYNAFNSNDKDLSDEMIEDESIESIEAAATADDIASQEDQSEEEV